MDYAFGRAVDGYNGYSILNIDFNNSLCNIFLRTYYAKDRNDFDSAINLVENGQVSYPLNGNIAEKQMEFNIVNGIHNYFTNMSETLSLIKEIDTYSPLDIEEVFVEPILSEESEYVSESSGKVETICLDELLDDTDNVILFGKKESGKTTILQQIGLKYIDKYNELEIIPVHIDMRNLPKKSDKLTNAAVYFVMKNMFDDATIRKEKVKELIDNGKIVFLIDNIDISNASICMDMHDCLDMCAETLEMRAYLVALEATTYILIAGVKSVSYTHLEDHRRDPEGYPGTFGGDETAISADGQCGMCPHRYDDWVRSGRLRARGGCHHVRGEEREKSEPHLSRMKRLPTGQGKRIRKSEGDTGR